MLEVDRGLHAVAVVREDLLAEGAFAIADEFGEDLPRDTEHRALGRVGALIADG